MWEKIAEKVFGIIAQELTALSAVFMVLFAWGEYKSNAVRKRVGVVLDAKDAHILTLTDKLLGAVAGYEKLTGLLERILTKEKEG